MKTIRFKKLIFGFIPYYRTLEKPRIRRCSPSGKFSKRYGEFRRCYSCEGAGQIGFGLTPVEAWNDWANWALI